MTASTVSAQHGRTTGMDIHDIVRELNAVLGSTLVAALSGSKDRKLPDRWAKPDGPEPRGQLANRLQFAHRQWALLAAADGNRVARQWFIGANPLLDATTPITAIREDRHDAVARAARPSSPATSTSDRALRERECALTPRPTSERMRPDSADKCEYRGSSTDPLK